MSKAIAKVEHLERRLGADWRHLRAARSLAAESRETLRNALKDFDSEDTSIVVSGSLARDEFTEGSDIDWTLLIDGQANSAHHDLALKVRQIVNQIAAKEPGREGTFGKMVFSHDLVHAIGGEDDTNVNTTRRLLLLLESCAIGRDDAYRRVVRMILQRYLPEDRGFWKGSQYRVPRFLQNDFARYWRTMAVDFAYKLRDRSGQGWALRNMKLRMSRKLIYVSGLLVCYGCHWDFRIEEHEWREIADSPDVKDDVINYLTVVLSEAPLEILADRLLALPHLGTTARKLFDAYDEFLGMLADRRIRQHLDDLPEEKAGTDVVYQRARALSHEFRDGLLELFFDDQSEMIILTKNYGVF